MAKEIVHCIELKPGIYMVSDELKKELEKQTQKTEWTGSIFGAEIIKSDALPVEMEVNHEAS